VNAQSKVEAATLSSAMALAFAEIEAATKSAENAAFKQGGKASKYANINAVIEAIKPALIKHQLFFTQHPQPSERGVTVETVLHHAGGEHFSLGALYVPANKQDPHGFGSALTYARRYALVTAFGVPVEDDDGNKAVETINSPRADPAPLDRPALITDAQRDLIQTLAPGAGKSVQGICQAYKVPALTSLTEAQGAAIIIKLQELAKAPEPVK
jgi:hypothetical protein